MPWKEICVIDERTKMIGEYLSGNYSVSELARRWGISRRVVYKWIDAVLAGYCGEDQSIAGCRSPAPMELRLSSMA